MAQKLDLSIIVVSYNTRRLLSRCLASVTKKLRKSEIKSEVIVVDNNSTDKSVEVVKSLQSTVSGLQLIRNEKNLGFARANNQAAKKAAGRYLLFLNSDTTVKKGALEQMMRFMDQHPKVGIASCQLRSLDGSVQPQGGWLPRLSTVLVWAWFIDDLPLLRRVLPSYQNRRQAFFTGQSKKLGWVSGTAMWVRKEAWKKLGGFDQSLFMYGEDVELCYRANQLGWVVMVNPKAAVTHLGRASDRGEAGWITGEVKGLIHFFKKHKPKWEMPILRLILSIGLGSRWFIFGILSGDRLAKEAYGKAVALARR